MSIVTFWNGTDEQCGNTSSSLAFAVHTAIEHNIRVLFISTALNETLIKDSFWKTDKKRNIGLFAMSRNSFVETSGIEGLDRVIRSNKISPQIITDYTKIILKDRLEVLLGVEDTQGQYDLIKEKYSQIINLAGKFYDMVIVDLDRRVGEQTEVEILNESDVVVAMIPQRIKKIEKIQEMIKENNILKEKNTILTIGKYFSNTKYNLKNISRSVLKQKDIINCVPFNSLFFEATQEGKLIDLFLNFMKLKEKDTNYAFIQELQRLHTNVEENIKALRLE